MLIIPVQISRFVRDDNPGWVECVLVDALGQSHSFTEKVPVVTREDLDAESNYPCSGTIACELNEEWKDDMGRSLARVSTERPWGVESSAGLTQFVLLSSQLCHG